MSYLANLITAQEAVRDAKTVRREASRQDPDGDVDGGANEVRAQEAVDEARCWLGQAVLGRAARST